MGRQEVFTPPFHSPLQHPPPLWGNDFSGTVSEDWVFASLKCGDKHEGVYETLWQYQLQVGSIGQHSKSGPVTLATGCQRGEKIFMSWPFRRVRALASQSFCQLPASKKPLTARLLPRGNATSSPPEEQRASVCLSFLPSAHMGSRPGEDAGSILPGWHKCCYKHSGNITYFS